MELWIELTLWTYGQGMETIYCNIIVVSLYAIVLQQSLHALHDTQYTYCNIKSTFFYFLRGKYARSRKNIRIFNYICTNNFGFAYMSGDLSCLIWAPNFPTYRHRLGDAQRDIICYHPSRSLLYLTRPNLDILGVDTSWLPAACPDIFSLLPFG